MLVPAIDLLEKAQKGKYAVGAFNTCNLEITQAIIAAAARLKSPVIISTSEGEIHFGGIKYLSKIISEAAEGAKVPVAMHLDHGKSLEIALDCLDVGYTSVHIDGSAFPFSENVGLTLGVVESAHGLGASVEGEFGHVTSSSTIHKNQKIKEVIEKIDLTDPDKAADFVSSTGIDSLAVAIGNAHGIYKTAPKLDFKRLKKIKENVRIPLVLHGGSGIPDKDIKQAIKNGICKINVNTEIRAAFTSTLRKALSNSPEEVVPYNYLPDCRQAVYEVVLKKIKLFGSQNKA